MCAGPGNQRAGSGSGRAELGGPGQLTETPVRAGELAGRLAAYGYEHVLKRLGNTGNGIAAAQRSWTSPGESARLWLGVEEHFLARPAPGRT